MTGQFAALKEEFFKLRPPTVHFFITLHVIAIVRVLLTRGSSFPVRYIGRECAIRMFFGPLPHGGS